jgi:8-oxo-dGTP diphosphatase
MSQEVYLFTIGAFAIISDQQGRVLLCHRRDMDAWNLPGGGVESGELPTEAVIREVREETGLEAAVERLVGVYGKTDRDELVFSFICRVVGGQLTVTDESDECRFFPVAQLPSNTSPKHVERIQVAAQVEGQPIFRRQTGPSTRAMLARHGVTDQPRSITEEYLDLLDRQRKAVFASLDGLSAQQIWQRPAPKEWCIGEILSHTARVLASFLPFFQVTWALGSWLGHLRRNRPYPVEIENVYRRPGFPMWTGFLWPPRHNPQKPVPVATLKAEAESIHSRIRAFYSGKDEDVLGNIYAYDPAVGVVNLITALKVGTDHDQLHYDDVLRMVASLQAGE